MPSDQTARVLFEVAAERARQDAKWGQQNHPLEQQGLVSTGNDAAYFRDRRCITIGLEAGADYIRQQCGRRAQAGNLTWFHILIEEVAEAAELGHDPTACRAELVQVAAVTIAMIECIDRNAEVLDAE